MKITKNESTILIISLLLIASTCIGVSLNGGDKGWFYLNGAFRDFISGKWDRTVNNLEVLLLISTIALYLMPLFILSKYKRRIFIVVPAVYMVLTLISFPFYIILLIPFILLWIALIVLFRENKALTLIK